MSFIYYLFIIYILYLLYALHNKFSYIKEEVSLFIRYTKTKQNNRLSNRDAKFSRKKEAR